MIYDSIYKYPFEKLRFTPLPRKAGETGGTDEKKAPKYKAAEIAAFDIETTAVPELAQSFMYVWQFCIEEDVIIGRTWQEFKRLLYLVGRQLKEQDLCLVVYVHNLSYEIQYLAGIYHYNDYEVFCTDSRKVLKATMYKRFEFRCSYRLTNMSLDEAAAKFNKVYTKLHGFDYSKTRYPDTPLDEEELAYATHDVLATVELVHRLNDLYGDDLYTTPLTSTGYVRRELKHAMEPVRMRLHDIAPPYECYKLLRAAFRGGNCHANRYYAGHIIDNVGSDDISSSYPSQQCNKKFPMTKWNSVKSGSLVPSLIEKRIEQGAAFIMRIALVEVELRYRYNPVPYIPIAKCIELHFPYDSGVCTDNGRILQAAYIEIAVTDIDYNIIMQQYKCKEVHILEAYSSWYGYLPDEWRGVNIEHYKAKTELKGIEGQDLYYEKAKNLLNGIYGDSVQDVCKENILFADLQYVLKEYEHIEDEEKAYKAKMRAPYKLYQWGVWTTAHARAQLQQAVDKCGDNFVYCDTDCVKYCGKMDFTAENSAAIASSLQSGLYATDRKGIVHYGGVFEHDGEYRRFITQGAKKYAYEDLQGKLHITVSGVSKKYGAAELERKGGLNAFKPGFIFTEARKTESVYNDTNTGITELDGHKVELYRNVMIRETTYKLGYGRDYAELISTLLSSSEETLNKIHKHWLNCKG